MNITVIVIKQKSETLCLLRRFTRIREAHICNGNMYCSCKYRNRYGIDCPHIYHVINRSKKFEETSYQEISVCWWNKFYPISCLSSDNKEFEEFDALEKAMKILQLNENDDLPVQIKWFNHLPNQNKKNILYELKNK